MKISEVVEKLEKLNPVSGTEDGLEVLYEGDIEGYVTEIDKHNNELVVDRSGEQMLLENIIEELKLLDQDDNLEIHIDDYGIEFSINNIVDSEEEGHYIEVDS